MKQYEIIRYWTRRYPVAATLIVAAVIVCVIALVRV